MQCKKLPGWCPIEVDVEGSDDQLGGGTALPLTSSRVADEVVGIVL